MKTYTIKKTVKIKPGGYLPRALAFTVIAIACCLNQAMAQGHSNQSDWNVPPPVPPPLHPGATTKASPDRKAQLDKPLTLSLSDIPPVSLPAAPSVQLPVFAAISTMPPVVNIPNQPTILGIESNLPEIPLPGAPETPVLPKQSLQDLPVTIPDLPIPTSPELPASPAEPAPWGQPIPSNVLMPVMPEVFGPAMPKLPANSNGLYPWPTPEIPENAAFRLLTTGAKAGKPGGTRGTRKVKSKSVIK